MSTMTIISPNGVRSATISTIHHTFTLIIYNTKSFTSQNVPIVFQAKTGPLVVVRADRGEESADLLGIQILSTVGPKA